MKEATEEELIELGVRIAVASQKLSFAEQMVVETRTKLDGVLHWYNTMRGLGLAPVSAKFEGSRRPPDAENPKGKSPVNEAEILSDTGVTL